MWWNGKSIMRRGIDKVNDLCYFSVFDEAYERDDKLCREAGRKETLE